MQLITSSSSRRFAALSSVGRELADEPFSFAGDTALADSLFWWSLILSLVIAFLVAVPLNRWLIARGRGHAVVHGLH